MTIGAVIRVTVNPFVAILITGSRIFHGDNNKLEKKIKDGYLNMGLEDVTGLKMFEIIGILVQISFY